MLIWKGKSFPKGKTKLNAVGAHICSGETSHSGKGKMKNEKYVKVEKIKNKKSAREGVPLRKNVCAWEDWTQRGSEVGSAFQGQ